MRRHHADLDIFDEDGLLRDGAIYRVPLVLRDSAGGERPNPALTPLQRAIGQAQITDAFGGVGGLHRPGSRVNTAISDDAYVALARARAEYDEAIVNAWRPENARRCDSVACTAEDHAVPDYTCWTLDEIASERQRRTRQAYADYDQELRQLWRRR
jgi:hypothetical protein